MFKEVATKEGRKFLLNTTDVAFIGERYQAPTRLYDEEGNLVSETQPTDKIYEVVLILKNNYHKVVVIDQTTYDDLVKELTK